MSIPTRVAAAAFFVFALVSTTQGHAQAPVQVSTQEQALPADDDFNARRGPAAAGDAQAQFALGHDYIDGRGVAQDYGQAVIWYSFGTTWSADPTKSNRWPFRSRKSSPNSTLTYQSRV